MQAQILNLLKDLQQRLGLAYLFITHNISVVEFLAHEVAVMYLGRIVEQGAVRRVCSARHVIPTRERCCPRCRSSIRRPGAKSSGCRASLPSPVNPPSGCHFHPRCPNVMPECRQAYPGKRTVSGTHSVRCFLYGKGCVAGPVPRSGAPSGDVSCSRGGRGGGREAVRLTGRESW